MTAERDPRFKPNPGYCPAEAEGRRVVVELANGRVSGLESVTSVTPPGWNASRKGQTPGTRWSIKGEPFDVAFYYVL